MVQGKLRSGFLKYFYIHCSYCIDITACGRGSQCPSREYRSLLNWLLYVQPVDISLDKTVEPQPK